MAKEARETNSIICEVGFFADDNNIIFASPNIELQEFFSIVKLIRNLTRFRILKMSSRSHECDADHSQADNNQGFPLIDGHIDVEVDRMDSSTTTSQTPTLLTYAVLQYVKGRC